MNRSKPRDDRFWQRWRWSGAVPAEAVLRTAREAVDRASFAPPDAEEEDTVEVEARTLRNGVREVVLSVRAARTLPKVQLPARGQRGGGPLPGEAGAKVLFLDAARGARRATGGEAQAGKVLPLRRRVLL